MGRTTRRRSSWNSAKGPGPAKRTLRRLGRAAGARIARQHGAVRHEQLDVDDVLVHRRGAQGFGRRGRVVEGQGRDAVGADHVGQQRDLADEPRPGVQIVVDREDGAGRKHRDPARRQHRGRELASDRLPAKPGGEAGEHRRWVRPSPISAAIGKGAVSFFEGSDVADLTNSGPGSA